MSRCRSITQICFSLSEGCSHSLTMIAVH